MDEKLKFFLELGIVAISFFIGLVSLFLGLRSIRFIRINIDALKRQNETGIKSERNERFKNAIEQLGNDKNAIILGGIYTLHRIAKEDESYTENVFNILCAFVRDTTTTEEYKSKYTEKPSEPIQTILNILCKNEKDLKVYRTDESKLVKNFSGAYLRKSDLIEANLSNANLNGANFSEANLGNANLILANLIKANLTFACLFMAKLGTAYLSNANLAGALLANANLSSALLAEANLSGAYLVAVNFSGTHLASTILKGVFCSVSIDDKSVEELFMGEWKLQKYHMILLLILIITPVERLRIMRISHLRITLGVGILRTFKGAKL